MSEEPEDLSGKTAGREVYVIGDAGYDRFVRPAEKPDTVESGAPFIATMLGKVLPETFEVHSLVTNRTNGVPGGVVGCLEQKDLVLAPYQETLRVKSYVKTNPEKVVDGDPYTLHDPASEPPWNDVRRGRTILVAHHAARANWDDVAYAHCQRIVDTVAPADPLNKPYEPWGAIRFPRILVNLSEGLPESNRKPSDFKKAPFQSALWNLLEKRKENVGIVMSMSSLRAQSAVISRRLSVEQLVEDFCAELHLFPALSLLGRFSHFFVRVGMIAVVHIERSKDISTDRFSGEVYFSPYARNGLHRDAELEGGTLGRNAVLIGSLLQTLVDVDVQRECKAVGVEEEVEDEKLPDDVWSERFRAFMRHASRRALRGLKDMDDHGYHVEGDRPKTIVERTAASAQRALNGKVEAEPAQKDEDKELVRARQDKAAFGWRSIPAHLLVPPPPKAAGSLEPWHILDEVLMEAPIHRINVALAIVMAGHHHVLNRRWAMNGKMDALQSEIASILSRVEFWDPSDHAPDFVTLQDNSEPSLPRWAGNVPSPTKPIIGELSKPFELSIPVMQFGKLNLIERDEIESLRSIANLLRLHREQAQRAKAKAKPISIAVFGPPGSGKSFAVKQLITTVGATEEQVPLMEFNVAQFSGSDQMRLALIEVASKKNESGTVTPLVFFDEFDCAREGNELGWLKNFLAPMQDGTLPDGVTNVGPAIFVFAGGLYPSFNRFDPRTDAAYDNLRDSDEYQSRLKRFVAQKGPDFISRLRGHIDVLPINDLPGRPKHFIRRAMQLRSLLEKNELAKRDAMAEIDQALVYAFLTADVFRHGVRSMQAIVEMCSPIHGRIQIASLPSHAQLDMHVDANEFMVRVRRGRARLQDVYKSEEGRSLEDGREMLRREKQAASSRSKASPEAAPKGQAVFPLFLPPQSMGWPRSSIE